MESKRLIIVVDSTAELSFHWQFSLKDLLADIVRYIHPEGSTSQDPGAPKPSLSLIVYGSEGPCIEPDIHSSGWTCNINTYFEWLSAISFTGGKFREAALAKGLSTALETNEAAKDEYEVQLFGRSHCILVTSCKSFPDDQMSDNISLQKLDRSLTTSVANRFIESSVSLSVISPTRSSRLKEIFQAGNIKMQIADSFADDQEDLDYLILLSDNFMESHEALSYRDFLVEPEGEKEKINDFVFRSYISEENRSDGDMRMNGDFLTEALQKNSHESSLVDALSEIEVRLMLDADYD